MALRRVSSNETANWTKFDWRSILNRPLRKLGMYYLVDLFVELLYAPKIKVNCIVFNYFNDQQNRGYYKFQSSMTESLRSDDTLFNAVKSSPWLLWPKFGDSVEIKVMVQNGNAKVPDRIRFPFVEENDGRWLKIEPRNDTIGDIFMAKPKRYLSVLRGGVSVL